MVSIARSMIIVFAVIAAVGSATSAFFTDTEVSTGNILTAGLLNLTVGNRSTVGGDVYAAQSWSVSDLDSTHQLFSLQSVKPGDYGASMMTMYVNNSDAWLRLKFTITQDSDNGCTEPESDGSDDPECSGNEGSVGGTGELDKDLFSMIWIDSNQDGAKQSDETIIVASNADAQVPWNPGEISMWASSNGGSLTANIPIFGTSGQMLAGKEYPVTFAWCVGLPSGVSSDNSSAVMTTTLAGSSVDFKTCSGVGVGNRSQSDVLSASFQADVVQYRHNEVNPQF